MKQSSKDGVLGINQQEKKMIIWRAKVLILPKLPKLFPSSCVFCLCLWCMHLDGTGLSGDKCHIHLKGLGYGLSISQSISIYIYFLLSAV